MAQFFEEEKKYPDNAQRLNFVFMAYPFKPALSQDDYTAVVKELQTELPVRLWYFLDEVTTQELMRKIWRAILRSDLAVFDISGGNANVAFELGLAAAIGKPCISLLKAGEKNPLGSADLGYSERAEYSSRETLKSKLRQLLKAKSSALRAINKASYESDNGGFTSPREQIELKLLKMVQHIFEKKKIAKSTARTLLGLDDTQTSVLLNALRTNEVIQVQGAKKGATWVLTDKWVYQDHEVVGG